MRQLYSSPRIENVQRLDELLKEKNIDTQITNRPKFGGGIKRPFSYRDVNTHDNWPTIWVVSANDYPQARQVMRDAGLLEDTRMSYLPEDSAEKTLAPKPKSPDQTASKARQLAMVMLVVTLGIIMLKFLHVL